MAKERIAELEVAITAQADKFNAAISEISTKIGRLETSTGKSLSSFSAKTVALGTTIGTIFGNVISKAFSTLTSNIDYATRRLDTLNRFPIVMQNLGIATEDASNAINALASYTLGLPTTLNDAAEKVQYFTSATNNVWSSIKIFQALNDAVISGAQTAEVQSTAIYQWSQAIVRGSFDIEREFNAMVVANAKAVNEISEHLLGTGKNFNDLWDALKKGTVSVTDMVNAMIYLDQNGSGSLESWASRAQKSVSGIDTAITRFKTNIGKAVAVVAEEIGWKNIYTFVNNVGDAIYKAGQYVAAFVRILKQAAAWVSALFGGSGSTSDIVKETGSASDNVGNLASNANDAASGLSDASKQAKNLSRQLFGFDKLNVLSQNKNSGSGSGSSGSGGGGLGSIDGSQFEWDSAIGNTSDKIAAIVDKIKKKLKELFGEFDLDKIGKAIKTFAKDVKKFLTPVGKIFSDVWGYIKPFIAWAGNELLPAFLNALGGAINLVGTVIGKLWDYALKPFIDQFLVPIAKFTGGVIVNVLNGIGDALRWIAENDAAVNVITTAIMAFAAYEVISHATVAVTGFITAFKAAMAGLTVETAALAGGGTAFANFGAKVGMVTSSVGSLKGVLAGIGETIFSPMTIAVEAATLAMLTYEAVQIANETAAIRARTAEMQRIDAEKLATEATNWHSDAIQRQVDLKDELRTATEEVTSAELNLVHAQQNAASALDKATTEARKHGMTVEEAKAYVNNLDLASGNLTDSDLALADAILGLTDAQNRQSDATRQLTEAKDKAAQKTEELHNQQWKEVMSTKEAELAAKVAEGKYNEVAQSLKAWARDSREVQLENGEMAQFTKDEMKNMAEFIGDRLAAINDGNGKTWKMIWKEAEASVDKLKGPISGAYYDSMFSAGENFQKGVVKGITDNQWRVNNAAFNSGIEAKNAFDRAQNSHSPSREMMKSGKNFDAGVVAGVKAGTKNVAKSATDLAKTAMEAFNGYGLDERLSADLSGGLSLPNKVSGQLELDEKQVPVHVTVNVGEERMVDRIIQCINEASHIKNRSVVNA